MIRQSVGRCLLLVDQFGQRLPAFSLQAHIARDKGIL
jgi:hypothetical protein